MKKFKSIFLISLFLVLLVVPVVFGKEVAPSNQNGAAGIEEFKNFFGSWSPYIASILGLDEENFSVPYVISLFIIFLILSYAFIDVFSFADIFSSETNRIIGIGLSIIFFLTGVTANIALFVFRIIAIWGAIGIAFSLFLIFSAFFLAHWMFGKYLWAIKRRRGVTKAKIVAQEAGSAFATLREMKKWFKKP